MHIASSLEIVETEALTNMLVRQLELNENAIRKSGLFSGLGITDQERIEIVKTMGL